LTDATERADGVSLWNPGNLWVVVSRRFFGRELLLLTTTYNKLAEQNTAKTNSEKTVEFKKYLQETAQNNGAESLGMRAVINNGPNKKLGIIAGILKLPENEEVIIFFDDTTFGSGKGGLALTSWGVRYKDNLLRSDWNLAWEELAEKYTLRAENVTK
jgi:hypothetical protein